MQKVAIYARVSTQKQEKENTIASQIEQLENYAKEKEYLVGKRYIDNGYSGELMARPALDKLRDDAQKGLFDAVLITCPDRLARKYIYKGLVEEELEKQKVEVIYLNRPIAKTPEDKLLSNIQGAVAEYERAKITERIRRGKLHKIKQGLILGHIPSYGYKYVKDENHRGHFEINPEEAKIVKMMFRWMVEEGLSVWFIAKRLAKLKIPPRYGKRWSPSTVHRILSNEVYIGTMYYYKKKSVIPEHPKKNNRYVRHEKSSNIKTPKSQWIPVKLPERVHIMDKATFQSAQEQLAKHKLFSPRNNKKHKYLLRGLIKCGTCGANFWGCVSENRPFPYRGYKCRGRVIKSFPPPPRCSAKRKQISARIIEPLVWETLGEYIRNPGLILKYLRKTRQNVKRDEGLIQERLNEIGVKFHRLGEEEKRIIKAFREKVVSMEQLKTQLSDINETKEALTEEKQRLRAEQTIKSPVTLPQSLKEALKTLSHNLNNCGFEMKQKTVQTFIKKIVIRDNEVEIESCIPSNFKVLNNNKIASIPSLYRGCNLALSFTIIKQIPRKLTKRQKVI
ncbi:recombinase family protein [candidate division WOR-3 bacterium]|nr:recombinase family protein [candidate division WOR-3 bacterium]